MKKKVWIKLSKDDTLELLTIFSLISPMTPIAKERKIRIIHELKEALNNFGD